MSVFRNALAKVNDRVEGAKRTSRKLGLDFVGVEGMCPDMVDGSQSDFAALVQRLCLEAGRIMEEESPALAMALPRLGDDIAARLACARQAGEDIAALMAAAEVFAKRADAEI